MIASGQTVCHTNSVSVTIFPETLGGSGAVRIHQDNHLQVADPCLQQPWKEYLPILAGVHTRRLGHGGSDFLLQGFRVPGAVISWDLLGRG